MAKKAFDIAALLGAEVSKLDTGDGAMRQIALDLIDENEKNFFHVDDIAELSDSISLNGLLQPLVVRPTDDGRYRLIAGHRRRQALLLLREADATVWRTVPCVVVTPSSDALEELMLIQTNTQSRELDWSDRNRSVERTEAILLELQEKQGVKLPGKMRTRVAEILKVSESAIARGKVIEAGLIDKWKKKKLNEDVAYRLARLPKADQLELYKHTDDYICGSDVTDYLKAQKEGRDPWAPEPEEPRNCYHGELISPCDNMPAMDARNADETLPVADRCNDRSCCWACSFRFDCPDCCAVRQKENKKAALDPSNLLYPLGRRLKAAREAADLTREQSTSLLSCEGACTLASFQTIAQACTLYHCSADYLLGLDAASGWGTGEPPEPGFYWCIVGPLSGGGKLFWWSGESWQHPAAPVDLTPVVACWMAMPSLPEAVTWTREERGNADV